MDSLLKLLQQGMDLQGQGKFIEAERLYMTVLHHAPDNADANNLMGTLALEAEDPGIAVSYFEKALKARPKDPVFRHNLGSALLAVDQLDEAALQLRKALELKAGQFESQLLLGNCLNRMGRSDETLDLMSRALRLRPGDPEAEVIHADALINLGRMDEAERILQSAILKPQPLGRAFQSLATVRKYDADAPELAATLTALTDQSLSQHQKKPLHYAAGKMLQDAKRHDESMAHYRAAKAGRRKPFDILRWERHIDATLSFFNAFFLKSRAGFGLDDQTPVFIVGMPRSGTTLTEQIISSHSEAAGAGELRKMAMIARNLGHNTRNFGLYAERLTRMSAEESKRLATDYLAFVRRQVGMNANRITDKMPHNFEHVGLITLLFPKASIIFCRRDAIDNCMSCYMNAFSEAHSYNDDFAILGRYYSAHEKLMRHWMKLLPQTIHESRYEELVADQEGESRKLINHIGLTWDEACLRYTETERSVTTISRWQVRQPIYTTSVKRWKPYERNIGELIKTLGDLADTA